MYNLSTDQVLEIMHRVSISNVRCWQQLEVIFYKKNIDFYLVQVNVMLCKNKIPSGHIYILNSFATQYIQELSYKYFITTVKLIIYYIFAEKCNKTPIFSNVHYIVFIFIVFGVYRFFFFFLLVRCLLNVGMYYYMPLLSRGVLLLSLL